RFLRDLRGLLANSGRLSVVVKNADALAYREAAGGRLAEARRLIADRRKCRGRMGVVTRAHRLPTFANALRRNGLAVERWFGVKVFCDEMTGAIDASSI